MAKREAVVAGPCEEASRHMLREFVRRFPSRDSKSTIVRCTPAAPDKRQTK
jgi:hypothetical protein